MMADMSGIRDGWYRRSAMLKWAGKSVAKLETMLCQRSEVDLKGTRGETKTQSKRRREEGTNEETRRGKKKDEEMRRRTKVDEEGLQRC